MQLDDTSEIQTNTEAEQGTATSTDSSGSLAAGFAKVRGGESHTEGQTTTAADTTNAGSKEEGTTSTETTEGAPANEGQVTNATGTTEVTEQDEIVPGLGMKASEVRTILAKAAEFDRLKEQMTTESQKMYGKFGEFQKKINAISTQAAAGQSVKVTRESLKRLQADYPELAEALADDLSELIKSPASGFDQAQVDTLVSEKLQTELSRVHRENERKLLTLAHRDWRTVIRSDEFGTWKGTLPEDKRRALEASYDALEIAEFITDFKGWKQSTVANAEAEKQRRANKLANSVVPNGMPAAGPMKTPDSKGLSAGFNKIRGGR